MARIRSRPPVIPESSLNDFVDTVVKAIKDEEQADGPVIFEISPRNPDVVEIIVVWERWAALSTEIRTKIVMEAYRQVGTQVPDALSEDQIAAILPVTADEAIDTGILSYSVQGSVLRGDARFEAIRQLLKKEGAIETELGTELRLPTLQMAREVRDRLQSLTKDMTPVVHWQISQQVGRIVDY
jgi:hypothetical protein